jgi:hypothetical protein
MKPNNSKLPFAKTPRKKTGKKAATVAEQAWMSRVAELGCMVPDCHAKEVSIHHWRPYGAPTDHYKVIPLCWSHHQGLFSIHKPQHQFEAKYGTQKELLIQVYEKILGKEILPAPAMAIYRKLKEGEG